MDTCDFLAAPVSYPQGQQPPVKRQVSGMQGIETPLWVRDPRSEEPAGFVFMPLGTGSPGTYNGTLGFSDTSALSDFSVIDGGGGVVWNNTGTWVSGVSDINFEVQDETQDLCVAAKAARSVDVSVSFTATEMVARASGVSGASLERSVSRWSVFGGVLIGIWWI